MRGKKKMVNYAKYGYIFCLPFVIAYAIFSLYPICYTVLIGFTDLKGLGVTNFHILDDPLRNFKTILSNPSFIMSLKNTVKIWTVNFLPQLGLALLLAAWYTDRRSKIRGQGFFKIIFYMPNIITAATVAILFAAFFGYPMGPVNDIFQTLGISSEPINFLQSKNTARGVVAFIQFWQWYGYTMIIFMSGILGISPEIFEAAEVDGANRTQTFFRITLPNIRTIMLFSLITNMIGGLNMFDIPQLFLGGGPDNATLTTSVFIYNQAFSGSYMYNRAAAASMLMFIIIAILSAFIFIMVSEKDEAKEAEKAAKKRKKGGMA